MPPLDLALVTHTGGSGLASNGRMFQQALQGLAVRHAMIDWEHGVLQPAHLQKAPLQLPRTASLFAVNADDMPQAVSRLEAKQALIARHVGAERRIGFFLWETTRAPRLHRLVQPWLHEVWVPTEFVRRVYRDLYDDAIPVHNVGKCLAPPPACAPEPAGLPAPSARSDGTFVFLNISDFDSSITRKHPLPVVQAFRQAFRGDADVRLVLKVRRIDPQHWSNFGHYWQRVLQAIGDDPRISILSGDLPERGYWDLLRSADGYVSLHRAEGFCYGAAHAMSLGVPVIVTDFSGSQDFCTPETAWLVDAEKVAVKPGEMRYHEDLGHWAEPDVAQAAAQMRAVREGARATARRTAAAREGVARQYSAAAFQAKVRQRLLAG